MTDLSISQLLSSGVGYLSAYSKHLYNSVRSAEDTYVTYVTEFSKHLYDFVKAMDVAHI